MTMSDLPDVFMLFSQGVIIGGLLSGLAFMIGWIINFVLSIVKSA